MKKLYDENELKNLKKLRKTYIFAVFASFLVANIAVILVFVFTNRNNLILMEIILAILMFLFLSTSAFLGLTYLRKTINRIRLINSFVLVTSKRNEVSGEVEYTNEKRKFYGFTFIKVKINEGYYFVEEGVDLPNNTKAVIKKGFVVAYE